MSIKPRTIDDLGVETSVRYAQDKAQLDSQLLNDSKWLPKKLEVSVTEPYISSEFDELFASDRINQWAAFVPPPHYGTQTRTLFSFQLVPSLGTYEKQESDMEKLTALKDVLSKHKDRQKQSNSSFSDEEDEKEEEDRKILLTLFKCIETLDKALAFINAKRNQYQRG